MNTNSNENFDILKELEMTAENIETNENTTQETQVNIDSITLENEIESIQKNDEPLTFDISKELEALEQNKKIEEPIVVEKVIKKRNSIVSGFIFLTKYLVTSSLIFGVLLLGSNYSAYINIAKSYFYAEELQETEQKLISSVEASNIKEKYSQEKLEQIESEESEDRKLTIKKMKKEQDKEDISLDIEITPYENRVIIPKIGKNIPLVDIKNRNVGWEEELNDIFMKELENGIIRYPGSAKPGEDGTSFIFGHSSNFPWIKWDYNDVFALLDNVEFEDEVIVYYGQEKYVYKIREKRVITPGDVSVLERNKNKSEITLMTCWPIGTTLNRLIVTWELVKQ